jgi:hypothetical protein
MPKALRVGFSRSYGRDEFVHGHHDADELDIPSENGFKMVQETLTMPVAKYQAIIVSGKAIIYLTLFVKFNSKAKLPKKPQPRDIAFKITSLRQYFSVSALIICQNEHSPVRIWDINPCGIQPLW